MTFTQYNEAQDLSKNRHMHRNLGWASARKLMLIMSLFGLALASAAAAESWLWTGAVPLAGLLTYLLGREQRLKLVESRERLELALVGSNDGWWDWNIAASEIYYSPRWKAILGYEEHELTQSLTLWRGLVHPEDIDKVRKCVWSYLRHELSGFEIEHRMMTKSGEYKWVLLRGTAQWDKAGKPSRMAGTITDISVRKQSEMETRRARELAETAAKAKDEFLANMSHELRTPINSIVSVNSLMQDTSLSAEQAEYVRVIDQAAGGLLTVIDDILDYSKIEAGKLELEVLEFNMSSLLNDLSCVMSYPAAQKGLQFNLEMPPQLETHFKGDPSRIRQILMNLISNAIKFTNEGFVKLKLHAERETGGTRLRFDVEDTGPGIPAESLPRLFQAFSQGDTSTSRRYGGTGLGLSISKRLAEQMGGSISVSSKPDSGSTFSLHLKLEEGTAISPTEHQTIAPAAPVPFPKSELNARILVAEDNSVNQKITVTMLTKAGFRVVAASNGAEVLDILRTVPVDLILMDCQMPEMDGYQATKIIRESKSLNQARVPIIAMTAHAMPGAREHCLEAGMDDYISKPVKVGVLIDLVNSWLKRTGVGATAEGLGSSYVSDDKELLLDLAKLFRAKLPEHFEKIASSLDARDFKSLRSEAHQLKSSSLFMGFEMISSICREMDSDQNPDSYLFYAQLVNRLRGELQSVYDILDATIAA